MKNKTNFICIIFAAILHYAPFELNAQQYIRLSNQIGVQFNYNQDLVDGKQKSYTIGLSKELNNVIIPLVLFEAGTLTSKNEIGKLPNNRLGYGADFKFIQTFIRKKIRTKKNCIKIKMKFTNGYLVYSDLTKGIRAPNLLETNLKTAFSLVYSRMSKKIKSKNKEINIGLFARKSLTELNTKITFGLRIGITFNRYNIYKWSNEI
jgi:hypothetical protein